MKGIAISGKMCSGKTTLLNLLQSHDSDIQRVSLADPVKEVASKYFLMPSQQKDRWLLQQIGQRFRSIRPSVWVDLLHMKSDIFKANGFIPVCDDVRFPNELDSMRSKGWILIRLKIPEEVQQERIKRTYGKEWESHWKNRFEESETSLDHIDDSRFDYVCENLEYEDLESLAHEIFKTYDQ